MTIRQEAWNDVYDDAVSKSSGEKPPPEGKNAEYGYYDKCGNWVETSYSHKVVFTPFGAIDPETGAKMILDSSTKTWTHEAN